MKEDCTVDLREDPKLGVIIANLTEVPVADLTSTLKQLEIGSRKVRLLNCLLINLVYF